MIPTSNFDPSRKYVRVTDLRRDGFVEFEFAIGEPELLVEMILPTAAFDEFCTLNEVSFIDDNLRLKLDAGDDAADRADWNWSLHDATHRRFKSSE
jgi:phenol hydroxylase P0 protein